MAFTFEEYTAMQDRVNRNRRQPGPQPVPVKPLKRIRQCSRPLMNKLEREWFNQLQATPDIHFLRAQALRFKLANGAWYKPDVTCQLGPCDRLKCYECKGPKQMKNIDRGILALKFAATAWPEIDFILVWKANGHFHQQPIFP